MTTKILIMGLPGSGKTFLAQELKNYIENNWSIQTVPVEKLISFSESFPLYSKKPKVKWFNADEIRKEYNDWDFSKEGRIRQSLRMAKFAIDSLADYAICDFVAPLPEMRHNFKADWTIWMDTIDEGRFEDTNKMFVKPDLYDFHINEKNAKHWAKYIGNHIISEKRRPVFDWRKETVQMLGRWQPWHKGHRALFERALEKTGQVVIQIRDCQGWQNSNPFAIEQVKNYIKRDLDPLYQGQYEIQVVPNIVNITYGRDVGYKIEQEVFTDEIHSISATKIREEMHINSVLTK
jgi:phosphopantetheine adenylyltransferase